MSAKRFDQVPPTCIEVAIDYREQKKALIKAWAGAQFRCIESTPPRQWGLSETDRHRRVSPSIATVGKHGSKQSKRNATKTVRPVAPAAAAAVDPTRHASEREDPLRGATMG